MDRATQGRRRQRLLVRHFPGWEVLRAGVARAVGAPLAAVNARSEAPEAAVWLDARAQISSFQLIVTLDLDLQRIPVASDMERAEALAAALRDDVVADDLDDAPGEPRPLFRAGGGEGEARIWIRADGSLGVEELVPPVAPRAPRDDQPAGVLARFAAQGERIGGVTCWSRRVAHQVVAAATEARLAVSRVQIVLPTGARRDLYKPAPVPRAPWAEVVFRSNGEAIAAMERTEGDPRIAVELMAREGYFLSRSVLPLTERSDEELDWSLRSLDASLAMAAAAGCLPDEGATAELDRLREELAARGRPRS